MTSSAPACAATSPGRSRSRRPSPPSTPTPPPRRATDWSQIVALYDLLHTLRPNAVVALNRAIAIAELHGPIEGLAALESLERHPLEQYQPYHAARADLLARAGDRDAAGTAYDRAIELTVNPAERRFLEGQRGALAGPGAHPGRARPR